MGTYLFNFEIMKTKIISKNEKVLHQQFVQYGQNAKQWMRKCILLLPEIDKQRIWENKGFSSIYEYAAKLAGMSRETVNDALRIIKKLEDKPDLLRVIEQKGINAVRPIVTIATSETACFWAEKAREMSNHTLRTYVKEYKKVWDVPDTENSRSDRQNMEESGEIELELFKNNDQISDPNLFGVSVAILEESKEEEMTAIWMELNKETAEELKRLKGDGEWEDLMREFIKLKKEKLEAEKPQSKETDSRHIPGKIKKFIFARCNGKCEFPCCNKTPKILHHTLRFAITKNHDPDQIRALCEEHERLAHLGLIKNEHKEPREWKVLKQADFDHPKHEIDKKVNLYRQNLMNLGSG